MKTIGMIEVTSIAKGIEICDGMIKAAKVKILEALPMCPGKYVIIVGGNLVDVKHSVENAADNAGSALIDSLLIPNIDEQVFKAVNGTSQVDNIKALGIIETFSAASGIKAVDAAVKAATVELLEIRLSRGMGGKSFVTLTGTVADTEAAVSAGCAAVKEEGLLAGFSVIPAPHEELKSYIF